MLTEGCGRYRIGRGPAGDMDRYTAAPGQTSVAWRAYGVSGGEAHVADMYLIAGGIIDGVVVDEDTGEAVGDDFGASIALTGPGGPQYAAIYGGGRFQFRVAPGASHLTMQPRQGWELLDTPDRPMPAVVGVVEGGTTEVVFRVRRLAEWDLPADEASR